MKNNLSHVLVLAGITLILSACATTPPEFVLKDSKGCGSKVFGKEWATSNQVSATWTGACEKKLATGVGVLSATTASGERVTYEGRMVNGKRQTNPGEVAVYTDGTLVKKGSWKDGNLLEGQILNKGVVTKEGNFFPNGNLFRGKFYDAGRLTFDGYYTYDGKMSKGKYYFANGLVLDGEIITEMSGFNVDGKGIKSAVVYNADGSPSHWIENQKKYYTLRARNEAVAAANAEAARQAQQAQLESAADQAALAEGARISSPPDLSPTEAYAGMSCSQSYRELHNINVRKEFMRRKQSSQETSAMLNGLGTLAMDYSNMKSGAATQASDRAFRDSLDADAGAAKAKAREYEQEKAGLERRSTLVKELIAVNGCQRTP